MKKLFVIMFVMITAVAVAQPGRGRSMTAEERAKSATNRLDSLVSLSADQKVKIEAIELDIQKQMDARRQNSQGDREATWKAVEEIVKLREEKYKAVLTADQFKKYIDNRPQRSRERGQGGGGQRPR